jgi:hypothetical protein
MFCQEELRKDMKRYNVGEDCPIFSGMYRFCQVGFTLPTVSVCRMMTMGVPVGASGIQAQASVFTRTLTSFLVA